MVLHFVGIFHEKTMVKPYQTKTHAKSKKATGVCNEPDDGDFLVSLDPVNIWIKLFLLYLMALCLT